MKLAPIWSRNWVLIGWVIWWIIAEIKGWLREWFELPLASEIFPETVRPEHYLKGPRILFFLFGKIERKTEHIPCSKPCANQPQNCSLKLPSVQKVIFLWIQKKKGLISPSLCLVQKTPKSWSKNPTKLSRENWFIPEKIQTIFYSRKHVFPGSRLSRKTPKYCPENRVKRLSRKLIHSGEKLSRNYPKTWPVFQPIFGPENTPLFTSKPSIFESRKLGSWRAKTVEIKR